MEASAPTPGTGERLDENALQEFEDYEAVMDTIRKVAKGGLSEREIEHLLDAFKKTFDKYLEQPYLLDGHLAEIVHALVKPVKSPDCTDDVLHACMRFLVVVTKVRGYKVVVNHLPHELSDIEPVLALLERVAPDSLKLRPATYMLLLWLGVLSMVPFQLSRLDSGDSGVKPVAQRIYEVMKANLTAIQKANDASSFLSAHFITRPDIKDLYFDDFMVWLQDQIDPKNKVTTTNVLSTLAMIFKLAKRDVVMKHAPSIMSMLAEKKLFLCSDFVIERLALKLCQRIGLCFLPVNLASWRHLRCIKQLSQNVPENGPLSEAAFPTAQENGEVDVPEIVEEVVDKLLEGLENCSLDVRWSAAKGIGRIASRLPKEFACEIVSSVFSIFEKQKSESSLHGACLALAELGRRGTLLPEQLPDVVSSVLPCLEFDEQLGKQCFGRVVRDAACYVCWTLSRSYDPCHLAPFVNAIASALVCITLFDREVMCRRAAAAAFQECVGRLGTFPHGIDIITVANYYSLALAQNCYLSLSLQVAKFMDYTQPLILHLVEKKSGHWDPHIRTLCAQALFKLTVDDPGFVRETCVPKLLAALHSRNLSSKLGALLSLGEIVHSLCELGEKGGESVHDALGSNTVEALKELASKFEEDKVFQGLGGDQMKEAFCLFICKLSSVHFPVHKSRPILEMWLSVITRCLLRDEASLRHSACMALSPFVEEYCKDENDICDKLIADYLGGLDSATEGVRCNFAHALGSLPKFLCGKYCEAILGRLMAAATAEGQEYVDSKTEAVLSLARFCVTAGVEEGGVTLSQIEAVLDILTQGMDDYTHCPKRGDAGANVRRACMTSFKDLICYLASVAPSSIPEAQVKSLVRALAQQCVEPVDNVCRLAITTFIELLYNVPEIPYIPHRDEARKILPANLASVINLRQAKETFPYWSQMLVLDSYREPLLKGFLVSVGGMSEQFFISGKETLLSFLGTVRQDRTLEESVYGFLAGLLSDQAFVNRALPKYLRAMDHLAVSGAFTGAPPEFAELLLREAWIKAHRSKSFLKLEALSSFLATWLQFEGDVRKKVLARLFLFLQHRWSKVRKATALRLCESLLLYPVLEDEEKLEEACRLLTEVDWNDVDVDTPVKRLKTLFGIESKS
uniref:Tubulin-specific chaperone D n=1 Tax=Rhipicephalus appendiculatus TaxID=34631 RepID=A0A131YZ53_RHIAP